MDVNPNIFFQLFRLLLIFAKAVIRYYFILFEKGTRGKCFRISLLTAFLLQVFGYVFYILYNLRGEDFSELNQIFTGEVKINEIFDLEFLIEFGKILAFNQLILFLVIYNGSKLVINVFGIEKKSRKVKPDKKAKKNPLSILIPPLELRNPFRGILIIGSAGSGKSVSIIRPIIKSAVEKDYCGILYDFKYPSLCQELNYYRHMNGNIQAREQYLINFEDLNKTHRVNPLHPSYIKDLSYAKEYATTIINNLKPESIQKQDFWISSSIEMLSAIIFFLAKKLPHLSSLPHVIALTLQPDDNIINLLSTDKQTKGVIASVITAFEKKADSQLAGVMSTLKNAIGSLNTPEIFYVLSGNDFSLEINNPQNPVWLTLGNNPQVSETYSPLFALITSVASKLMNQPHKNKSIIILDEAPTLYIPKLDTIPATARSNNLALVYCAQDLSQIEASYGKIKARNITANLNTQFFGRVSDIETAEMISKKFGKMDQKFTTENRGSSYGNQISTSTGESQTVQQRDRFTIQEILSLDEGEFAGIAVESNKKEFCIKFPLPMGGLMDLPVIREKAPVEDVFNNIHYDIENLFS